MNSETNKDLGFTFSDYCLTIERFKGEGYLVGSFAELIDSSVGRQVILRHDVDNSLDQAVRVAELESELGVTSSYFLRVHARGYNLLDLQSLKNIDRLRSLGHEIGLHLEGGLEKVIEGDLSQSEFLDLQRNAFEAASREPVRGISLHEPARLGGYSVADELAERWNLDYHTYQKRYFNGEYKYLSDSSGRWREGHFGEWVGKTPKLQVLTHPFWWYEQLPQEVY